MTEPVAEAAAPEAERTARQEVNSVRKVLILGSSVNGGTASREAAAAVALGMTVEVVTPAQWSVMTSEQFMSYRALIIGDGSCEPGLDAFKAAVDNRSIWGAVVDGNVVIIGANPTTNDSEQLVENGIRFASAQPKLTGMYVALGCAFQAAAPNTPVTLLEPFGSFAVAGVDCGVHTAGHPFTQYPSLFSEELAAGGLSGRECAARAVFTSYPGHNFSIAALGVDADGSLPGAQPYFDYDSQATFTGTPYILTSGAASVGLGCGGDSYNIAPGEECDMGDSGNGQPALHLEPEPTCSWSCKSSWCGDGILDASLGEECDEGVSNGRTTDSSANIGTCTAFCKIPSFASEGSPPQASCHNVTVVAEYACGVEASIDNGSSDPDGDLEGCTQSPAGPYAIGTTSVTLTCVDSANLSSSCTGTVTVVDHVAPTLTLQGPAGQTLECGSVYTDPGATATDLCEGDLTGTIVRMGTVNPSVPGAYSLSYGVTDAAGNTPEPVSRLVTVVDTMAPALTLGGLANEVLECGTPYVEPGFSANDACAGDLTGAVVRTGSVDHFGAGVSYALRYNVTDPSGHAAVEQSRVVTVRDTQAPTVTMVGPSQLVVECGDSSFADPGATASDACAGSLPAVPGRTVNPGAPGSYVITYSATDPSGNRGTTATSRTVTVSDTQPPQLQLLPGPSVLECNGTPYVDPGATASDLCSGDLTGNIVATSNLNQSVAGQYTVTYSVTDSAGNMATAVRQLTVGACSTCTNINLSDYNLFLLGDYNGGHDVEGKVAVGGNLTMTDFSVGHAVPDGATERTVVVGGDLTLRRGGVWGDAWYGGSFSADTTVVYPRGSTVSHGTPIDFAARFAELRTLSTKLAGLTVNGTTRRETWGGVMLRGTNAQLNVFKVNASAFTGAKLLSIDAPAGSLVVVNIYGASATFTGFGHSFSGGIDQHGILYNFVDTTSITAHGFGFWGTVLAPYAHVNFSDGSFDGGLYAVSLTGNAEGHINVLYDRQICR